MEYKVTYCAPYAFAKFSCVAATLEEARAALEAHHVAKSYCISRREIRSETFGGKPV